MYKVTTTRKRCMRLTLLDYIVCPKCQKRFELKILTQHGDHIMEGSLQCEGCGTSYAIQEGIPRLLDQHTIDQRNKTTAERFGQEWEDFDFIDIQRYTQQFLDWIFPVQSEFFYNKLILDAGCGKGRHCVVSAKFHAREVIGIDLADGSVITAFRNTKDTPNIHIIQANLYHLPFKSDTFDYVYSIGVLHHTPEPKKASICLVEKVKPGGAISAWVYGKEGNWWVISLLNPIRKFITAKLPLPILKFFAFVLSGILKGLLRGVYVPVNENRWLQPISRILFYNDYLYYIARFPFREVYCIVFDHLLPEIAFYIDREEFSSWFTANRLEHVRITQRTKNSWRGTGEKGR
jgi:SAM-dependent methyltransferase